MRLLIAFASIASLTACGPPGGYFADKVAEVNIDGYDIEVRRNRADSDIWEAFHNKPRSMPYADPKAGARNIRAIEQVSGCKADLTSITHIPPVAATTTALIC